MVGFVSKEFLNEMIAKGSYSKYVNLVLLIKDWNNIMELDSRQWLYQGTEIKGITRNWVVLLVRSIHVVGASPEDVHMLLVGPGVFHTTFRAGVGLVTDRREITGVTLSPRLIDLVGSAKKEYEGSTDLVLNEHVVEIPFSIMNRPIPLQEYERGLLAVKVFTAFKDAFKELKELCSGSDSFSKEHGLKILCTHLEFANRILVGKELGDWAERKVSKYVDHSEILSLAKDAREYMTNLPGAIVSQGYDELFLTRFLIQGMTGGYLTEDSQMLKTVDDIKRYILEKEIPQIKESYCKIRTSIAGGLFQSPNLP